jgi:Fur family transcriptional regulator, stress-responsive regulator
VTSLAPADRLRQAGLRVTVPRERVLEVVDRHPHSDAEGVLAALGDDTPRLSIQSVHNILRSLADHGVLRRIEPSDSAALYESRVGDNHHHVVCRGCGAVDDVPCVAGHAPCLTPSDAAGFEIDLAEVVFWGLCPACRARGVTPTSHPESPRRHHV